MIVVGLVTHVKILRCVRLVYVRYDKKMSKIALQGRSQSSSGRGGGHEKFVLPKTGIQLGERVQSYGKLTNKKQTDFACAPCASLTTGLLWHLSSEEY